MHTKRYFCINFTLLADEQTSNCTERIPLDGFHLYVDAGALRCLQDIVLLVQSGFVSRGHCPVVADDDERWFIVRRQCVAVP